ncbi:uncharacterized protein LOC131622496 [Vicia villosa]|uniref:uncharacterized protein LOC131622496 n=1 Tax=Vicia villosa TaxID=3911 RepID=UPI00273A8CAB|nr:uncharacterized protein LOC131622496 [Vicia villosa]
MSRNKSYRGNVALKIDIAKAFDTLNWDFLIETLSCFGFNSKFCHWIKVILNSASLSIGLNGKAIGYFKCTNGVRQGDPLSPLLFCIAEDVLSRGFTELVKNNQMNLIQATRHCHVPSHTLFADDIMVFCRGDVKSLKAISELLGEYALNSGQFFNKDKSLIYAGGLSQDRHTTLVDIVGFKKASPPFVYLGVPIFIGKSKVIHFLSIAGKIKLKLATWKTKLLSMAGRVLLVKTVIQSMMVHSITIYDWPMSIIKSIETWTRNFLWSGNMETRKLVTVSWKKCCKKTTKGGLEIISLKQYNKATNLYSCWQFLNNNSDWYKVLAARVLRQGRMINYSIKSSLWKGFKDHFNMIKDNTVWILGNGKKVNFWLDDWTGEPLALKFKIPEKFHANLVSKVTNYWKNNQWSLPANLLLARPNIMASISSYSVPDVGKEDLLAWKEIENGYLTIKHAYNILMPPLADKMFNFSWDSDAAPAHSMFCWRLLHNKISTDDNLRLRGFSFPSKCSLCCAHSESTLHLFFECQYARNIWTWLSDFISSPTPINSITDCYFIMETNWSPQARAVVKSLMLHALYLIWQAINLLRFKHKQTHWKFCVSSIMARARLVGNLTKKKANDSMLSFTFLKSLGININPRESLSLIDVLWCPPLFRWINCNVDDMAKGLMQIESLDRKRYVYMVIDDFSGFTCMNFLREKSDAFEVFKDLCQSIQEEQSSVIVKITSYHDKEFENTKFSEFCDSEEKMDVKDSVGTSYVWTDEALREEIFEFTGIKSMSLQSNKGLSTEEQIEQSKDLFTRYPNEEDIIEFNKEALKADGCFALRNSLFF